MTIIINHINKKKKKICILNLQLFHSSSFLDVLCQAMSLDIKKLYTKSHYLLSLLVPSVACAMKIWKSSSPRKYSAL